MRRDGRNLVSGTVNACACVRRRRRSRQGEILKVELRCTLPKTTMACLGTWSSRHPVQVLHLLGVVSDPKFPLVCFKPPPKVLS